MSKTKKIKWEDNPCPYLDFCPVKNCTLKNRFKQCEIYIERNLQERQGFSGGDPRDYGEYTP